MSPLCSLRFVRRVSVLLPAEERKGSVIAFQRLYKVRIGGAVHSAGNLRRPFFSNPCIRFDFNNMLSVCQHTLICVSGTAVTQLPQFCRELNFSQSLFVHLIAAALLLVLLIVPKGR